MRKPTLTIGIPAYNEERNISKLLKELLTQTSKDFILSQIIVASDGSTDNTVKTVSSMRNKKIKIIHFPVRRGKAIVLKYIFQKANSDMLVLIDADTSIRQKDFLAKLVSPIQKGADLTAARVEEFSPKTVIEKILFSSMQWKKDLFESINQGDNVYTCHGRARGFSKKLYKTITFPRSASEDAYSYFFCKTHSFRYSYVRKAHIFYQLPLTFGDHLSQSKRYFSSKQLFEKEFSKSYIDRQYSVSLQQIVRSFFIHALGNIWLLLYLPLVAITKLVSLVSVSRSNTWTIATSSKSVRG